jgi:hypothetical protein
MSSFLRLTLAFVLLIGAGSRVVELVERRGELAMLRAERASQELRLEELRGLRDALLADPSFATAIAERWERGELVLP